jgi:hypothetical protein
MKKIRIVGVSQVWWHKPGIPAFGRLRQEDYQV